MRSVILNLFQDLLNVINGMLKRDQHDKRVFRGAQMFHVKHFSIAASLINHSVKAKIVIPAKVGIYKISESPLTRG